MSRFRLCSAQVAESSSALFGAYAFDGLRLGVRAVALLMASVAAVTCCLWILYAWRQWPRGTESSGSPVDDREAVSAGDVEQQGLLSGGQQHHEPQ